MANPSVTYTFANATTADATQVNTNFSDLINALTDGLKDFDLGTCTVEGLTTLSGAVAIDATSTVIATNGGSSVVGATTSTVILAPSGTIASYTLTLPAAPVEGQILSIVSNGNTITALTLSANSGHTLATNAGASSLRAGQSIELIFRSTVWYCRGKNIFVPTIQKFTSGSGTYTTPANVSYIRVRMVGGGGGGGGGGNSSNGDGGAGGDSTFGTTLLVAGGGLKGVGAQGGVATGGSASLGTGPVGIAIPGGAGGNGSYTRVTSVFGIGGVGGASALGGNGSGAANLAGNAAATNSGGGGGGGGSGQNLNSWGGSGGGAGGYVDAIIVSPSATYSYVVGTGGAGGVAGTDGFAGGAGAAGIIVVEEYP
jgi:hypothetical protein